MAAFRGSIPRREGIKAHPNPNSASLPVLYSINVYCSSRQKDGSVNAVIVIFACVVFQVWSEEHVAGVLCVFYSVQCYKRFLKLLHHVCCLPLPDWISTDRNHQHISCTQ